MLNPVNLLTKLFKSPNQKELDQLAKLVVNISILEEQISKFESHKVITRWASAL